MRRRPAAARWSSLVPPAALSPAVSAQASPPAALPPSSLLWEQAAWFAPARSRLLRRVRIADRQRILDIACGPGAVTGELAARCAPEGAVIALDRSRAALVEFAASGREGSDLRCKTAPVQPIHGDAHHLPFPDHTFDLAFCQFALLWLDAPAVVAELARVLSPGGAVVAIEPDYDGMIEYPPEVVTGPLWRAGLARAGATPDIGRRLPGLFSAAGFRIHVELLDRLLPPAPARFELLRGLPLTCEERARLDQVAASTAASSHPTVVHLPLFLLTAELDSSVQQCTE